jgi:DNA-binding transcriptional regulator YiaG
MAKPLTNVELLREAIEATGLSHRTFAATLLLVDERTVRYWLAEAREIPGPVRVICRAIIDHPVVARALARAAEKLSGD